MIQSLYKQLIYKSIKMRFFTTVATLGLAAFALAQDTTATSSSSAPSSSASLTAEQRCLTECKQFTLVRPRNSADISLGAATDICCQAACVKVPCPNEADVNDTTACAGKCTQGNGTEEETAAYASCQASCISASFFNTATSTGRSGSATATGADATATGESATGIGESHTHGITERN